MPRNLCYIFSICAATVFVGGCPFMGRVYEEDLVNGYAVWAADVKEQAMIVRKGKGGSASTRIVQPMVFAYGWNDDFILAKQHPEKKDGKVDTSLTYWYIIEIAPNDVHGPLNEDEFRKLKNNLKVPEEISFKTIQ